LPADWIRDLKQSTSRAHKERVIERALIAYRLGSSNAECFLYNCYLAYNPNFQYGCKRVLKTEGLEFRPNPWDKFWGVCEMLRTNSLSRKKLEMIVGETSELFDSEQWNSVCRGVILKDLRCGINVKTLNKVLGNSEWRIPE